MKTSSPKLDAKTAAAHFKDPVWFARNILRHETWPTQESMLQSIKTNQRTAAKGCHGCSKTFTVAEAVLWWLTVFKDGKVITTGPSWAQVKEVVWGEIHKAIASSVIKFPKPNQTELVLGLGNYAIGISTNEAVRFQGRHGHLLIIVDEAPGLQMDIWDAIEGARSGGTVHVIALGNPTIPGGVFYDAFTSNRQGWKTFTIDAFNTPNLEGFTLETLRALPPGLSEGDEIFRYNPKPYLVSRRWVYERYQEWGERSPRWEARVRGQFPTQAEDALISLAWLEAAREREVTENAGKIAVGIDVAEAGEDETVMVFRQGPQVLKTLTWAGREAHNEALAALLPYRGRVEVVNFDSAGVGAYFGENIDAAGFNVQRINVGESPRDKERYRNLKAELYWGLRMRFEAGDVAGLLDERTISQLATVKYSYNARGQLEIESKEDARKRGIKSPDRAEAIMLAFADREPAIMKFYEEEIHRAQNAQSKGLSEPEPLEDDMSAVYEDALRELQREDKG